MAAEGEPVRRKGHDGLFAREAEGVAPRRGEGQDGPSESGIPPEPPPTPNPPEAKIPSPPRPNYRRKKRGTTKTLLQSSNKLATTAISAAGTAPVRIVRVSLSESPEMMSAP